MRVFPWDVSMKGSRWEEMFQRKITPSIYHRFAKLLLPPPKRPPTSLRLFPLTRVAAIPPSNRGCDQIFSSHIHVVKEKGAHESWLVYQSSNDNYSTIDSSAGIACGPSLLHNCMRNQLKFMLMRSLAVFLRSLTPYLWIVVIARLSSPTGETLVPPVSHATWESPVISNASRRKPPILILNVQQYCRSPLRHSAHQESPHHI